MLVNNKITKEIVECAGLWLAEGDKKCNNEINFSNNEFSLIELFDKTIRRLFSNHQFNVRIYVYTPNGEKVHIPIQNCKINRYIDKQATKPYFIWRLASVKLNKIWKDIVNKISNDKSYYILFLRGFFAGEGNIKTGSQGNRTLRIAQGKPLKLIEDMLNYFKIEYRYFQKERSYVITHKENWDKCAKIKIADLHPIRKTKFWKVYNSFKEEHYRVNYLKSAILNQLIKPYTSYELSSKFNRSRARISEVLSLLKKEGKTKNFRVKNKDYWIKKDQKIIIISKLKQDYLNFLKSQNKTTKEFSKHFNVDWKSSFRRLKELEKLGLVKRNKDKTWRRLNMNITVNVI